MHNNALPLLAGFAALTLAVCAPHAAAQTIIFEDDFDRDGILNGTAPDLANPGGVLWQDVGSNVTTSTANGGGAISGGASNLAFTPSAGYIYTLSIDVTVTNSTTSWISFGFTDSLSHSANPFEPSSTMLLRGTADGSGNWVQGFRGPFEQYTASPGPAANPFGVENNLAIVLDTTGAQWSTSSYVNGELAGTYVYTTNPTIAGVGINFGTAATFSHFTLSAVPEPATAVLLIGGLGLLTARRRVRRT